MSCLPDGVKDEEFLKNERGPRDEPWACRNTIADLVLRGLQWCQAMVCSLEVSLDSFSADFRCASARVLLAPLWSSRSQSSTTDARSGAEDVLCQGRLNTMTYASYV